MSTSIIVAYTPNGRNTVKTAYSCNDEADFIGRIAELARRGDSEINTVDAAVQYLNEKYAQQTDIITFEQFKAEADPYNTFDNEVLDQAQRLGWYEPEEEDIG